MDYEDLKLWAEYIINYSLENLVEKLDDDYLINQRLLDYEKSIFKIDK